LRRTKKNQQIVVENRRKQKKMLPRFGMVSKSWAERKNLKRFKLLTERSATRKITGIKGKKEEKNMWKTLQKSSTAIRRRRRGEKKGHGVD